MNAMKKCYYLFIFSLLCLLSCKDKEELLHPPVATEATQVYDKSFKANWKEYYGIEKFLLYVSEDAEFGTYLPGYEGKEVEGNSHVVEDLKPEHTYYYKVRAKIHGKLSDFSNIIEVTTAKKSLEAPVALKCKVLDYDRFKVYWEGVPEAEMYVLEVAYDKDFKRYVRNYERKVVEDLKAEVFYVEDNTTFYCRVRAVKDSTWSRYSNVLECKTPKNKHMLEKLVYKNGSLTIVIKAFYDEHDRINKVKIDDREYFYEYDQENRVKKVFRYEEGNKTVVDVFPYDVNGKVEWKYVDEDPPIRYDDREKGDYFYYAYEYVFGAYYHHYKRDEYGNLIEYQSSFGEGGEENYYTYAETKFPKGMNLLINDSFEELMKYQLPETYFPLWLKQIYNVKEHLYIAIYSLGTRHPVNYNFKYTYNEHGFPAYRKGTSDKGEVSELYFYYRGHADSPNAVQ
jgi:hypothetical protein